jgi:hypothetical protein
VDSQFPAAGVRLKTLADVFAYAAEGVDLRIDATEVQVRRPAAHKPGRRAFVSGKRKQNTGKSTVISDGEGRLLWQGAFRPGRMHDVTALRTEGVEDLLHRHPDVRAKVDSGYRGMARDFPNQVTAPPKKPGKDASADEIGAGKPSARPSPRPGSASSTPSPSPRSGGLCSVGSDAANTSPPPPKRSPPSCPTAAPSGKQPPAGPIQASAPQPQSCTKSLHPQASARRTRDWTCGFRPRSARRSVRWCCGATRSWDCGTAPTYPGLVSVIIHHERLVPVCPPGHPLAVGPADLDATALDATSSRLLQSGPFTTQLTCGFSQAGVRRRRRAPL